MTSKATEAESDNNRVKHAPKSGSPQKRVSVGNGEGSTGSPNKKRRKVNHACIYCRRSHMTCDLERPCTRCIKRNIGHLCHDEPREPVKKQKTETESAAGGDEGTSKAEPSEDDFDPHARTQDAGLILAPPHLPYNRAVSSGHIVQPTPVSALQVSPLTSNESQYLDYNDWNLGAQNHFQDMHTFHPSYMFNTSEVTNEFNLLNDFLSNSLLDDGVLYSSADMQGLYTDSTYANTMGSVPMNNVGQAVDQQSKDPPPPSQAAIGNAISRPASSFPNDKAREAFYLTAADPAGNDTPEERMNKLLKAKYDAGMLKPFNYVKGYARLNQYMERNMQPSSRQKILRQLDKFRPKFRERMQSLTDIELVRVEMWFERSLMEYDRVFASMAIPACCWRRTGEIVRGNKEMAELIHVPIEKLRDGKLAIHEIMAEGSLVSYWEKFGAIAFDNSQKALLTSCALKNPDSKSKDPELRCCFSFTIRRDTHNIPSLIVGNFLPILPAKRT